MYKMSLYLPGDERLLHENLPSISCSELSLLYGCNREYVHLHHHGNENATRGGLCNQNPIWCGADHFIANSNSSIPPACNVRLWYCQVRRPKASLPRTTAPGRQCRSMFCLLFICLQLLTSAQTATRNIDHRAHSRSTSFAVAA